MPCTPRPSDQRALTPARLVRWSTATIVALLAAAVVGMPAQADEPAEGLFSNAVVPEVSAVGHSTSAEVGVRIYPTTDGTVNAVQFYRGAKQRDRAFSGSVWSASGTRLARVTFAATSETGWQVATLASPVSVKAGEPFSVSYFAEGGRYPVSRTFTREYGQSGLTVPVNGGIRRFTNTSQWPSSGVNHGMNFLVDVSFIPQGGHEPTSTATTRPPTTVPTSTTGPVSSTSPTVVPAPSSASPAPSSTTPTPSATTTRAPEPTPGPGNVPGIPPGFPNASNTGVRSGVTLRDSGSITVTTPGAVIQGLRVNGTITVSANDVVIRDTLIRGGGNGYPIRVAPGVRNALIEYVDIDNLNSTGIGIFFNRGSGTVRYADIHSAEDGVRVGADNVTIEQSYIHDLHRMPGGHHDVIQIRSGNNVTIRGNSLLAYVRSTDDPMNAAIQIGSLTSSPLQNLRVINNYMNGGNYTINGGESGNIASGQFAGNVFGRDYRYGVRTGIGSNVSWSGNTEVNLG